MYHKFNSYSLQRARWVAELTIALLEAEQLLHRLEADDVPSVENLRLKQQIRLLHIELESMNRVILAEERIVGEAWPVASAGGC